MNASKANKIRILYLVSRLRQVGPGFQLYNLIRHLDRNRFQPYIITLSPEGQHSLIESFRNIEVTCDSLGLPRVAGMIFGPGRIRKLLEKNPADLVHVFDYRATLLCANHPMGIARVVTCRQSYRHIFGPILGSVMKKTFLKASGKCERVVAVSHAIGDLVKHELSRPIEVIHNGVDTERFKPVSEERRRSLRLQLGLPPGKRVFVSAGFLSKNKGVPTLIEAFLKGTDGRADVLVLLGDGPLRERCLRLAAGRDNVRIVGFVQNVEDYLAAADAFVSASLTEGCPNAVMEAMACGLPVVLSDIPPHREILALDERAGQVFTAGDVTSLLRALSRTPQMNQSERSAAALGIIKNHFDAAGMSLKYQELYAQLCDRAG
ncbi:MAG: glycosyltransferase [Phycisphaerales bacterium]|nr:MAG: glycosyltransferase [Phycisphaerales bacterium]